MINTITIEGRLTRDLTLKKQKDFNIVELNIANNYYSNGKQETNYFQVTTFIKDSQVNYYQTNFIKGALIVASGELRQSRYQNKNGYTQSNIYILANNITVMSSNKKADDIDDFDV